MINMLTNYYRRDIKIYYDLIVWVRRINTPLKVIAAYIIKNQTSGIGIIASQTVF